MKNIIILFIMLGSIEASSQESSLFMPAANKNAYKKGTRSYDGKPGVNYWTNRSDYQISAVFDPKAKKLQGSEKITYYNNSPDTLNMLVVKILQDIYKKGSARDRDLKEEQLTDGVNISSLKINETQYDLNNRKLSSHQGTNLIINLKKANKLSPKSSLTIEISWDYKVIPNGFRTGAFSDSSFFIGFWYPQMAVYDDYMGWDMGVYTGGQETYNDLANYDVEISLPSNYLTWATGDLLNSTEIFSDAINKRIEASKKSKEIVKIISQEDYKNKLTKGIGNLTWKYRAKDVPDFSWATSSYYLWDATTAVSDKKNNKTVWVNSLYPALSFDFKNVINYAKSSIEFFSTTTPGIPYLYDKHYTFNGHRQLAMEFPMMANNCDAPYKDYIFEITAHEIAHGYMPFYALSNEREYAWMDEGFVKLFGELALETRGVKRHKNHFLNSIYIHSDLAQSKFDVPLMTPSSSVNPETDFATSYAKAANALYYLNQIMAEKGITDPMKQFLEAWKDKHPTPYDFFFFMNTLAKEDLSWFWKPWYFEFSSPDLAIKAVQQEEGKRRITLENTGGQPSPVVLTITYDDKTTETITKTASIWKNGSIANIEIPGSKKIISIELGDEYIVDINPDNNIYTSENLTRKNSNNQQN